MKHIIISFLISFLCGFHLFAQAIGPYEESRRIGIDSYNKGKYEYALKCFNSVIKIAPPENDLAEWISKCKKAIQQKKMTKKDNEEKIKAREEAIRQLNRLLHRLSSSRNITSHVESEIRHIQHYINNKWSRYISDKEKKNINRLLDGLVRMSKQSADAKLISHWIRNYHVIPLTWDNLEKVSSQVNNIID